MPRSEQIDLEALLTHGAWLNRLAQRLTGFTAEADDLVQDTWVAALRAGPDRERSPRPWMVRVVHNLRRMHARGEIRRRSRESAVADSLGEGGAVDTASLVERVEVQRLVAKLVLGLDEPYKTTLLLRSYDDQSSSEISRYLGVPEGTVRWRLKEALARIRRGLDEQDEDLTKNWRAIIVPVGAPVSMGTTGKGGLLMAKSKLVASTLVVTLLGLLGGGAWWFANKSPPPRPPSSDLSYDLSDIERGRLRVFGSVAPAIGPRVLGRVFESNGNPIDGAHVAVIRASQDTRPDEPVHLRPRATSRSDHRGAFALELAGPGKYVVTASAPGFLPARKSLRLGKEESARIEIHLGGGGITVHGLVEDSGGGPIPGAQVWGLGEDVGIALTTTDAAGSYQLRLPRGRRVLFADADGYAPDRKNIETQSDLEQTFRLNPAAQLHGRVLDKTTASAVPGAISPDLRAAAGRVAPLLLFCCS